MQISNSFVAIDHCDIWSALVCSLDVCLDCSPLALRQRLNFAQQIAKPVVDIDAQFFKRFTVFLQGK